MKECAQIGLKKQNILFQTKERAVVMSQFVPKSSIYPKFMLLYLWTESRYFSHLFGFELTLG